MDGKYNMSIESKMLLVLSSPSVKNSRKKLQKFKKNGTIG